MQFRIKHLLAAAILTALLTVAIQFVVQRQSRFYGPVVLVLAGPALMGLVITTVSSVMAFRHSKLDSDEGIAAASKYKNLAVISVLALMPLVVYVVYCIAVRTPEC